jgi:AraC-like DNA-binding protein
MSYNFTKPSAQLAPYIKQIWSLENCLHEGSEHIQRIVPNGLFELIFYLKDRPEIVNTHYSINENIVITGQLKSYHDLKIKGELSLFAIDFLPQGLCLFLDIPPSALYNQSVPLKYILKHAVVKLEDELQAASTFNKKVEIAERFLLSQIHKTKLKYKHERIEFAIQQINKAKGVLDINELASDIYLSRKQFERSFLEIVGTSPKQFLKTIRFQNAIYEKSKNPDLNLTEIAYKCGYFDQSHMINDFKSMSGITPSAFFKHDDISSDYFSH